MNVLIVNMSVDPVRGGGTVERTLQLTKELKRLPNTSAKILSTTVGLSDQEVKGQDDSFVLLPCLSQRWYVPAPAFMTVYKVVKWADIIIIVGHWTLINALVYWVNKVVKRPYLFCPAGALHIFGRSNIIKHIYNFVVGKRILKQANRVIAIPKEERDFFCTLGVAKEKVAVIPNGISPNDFIYKDDKKFRAHYNIGKAPFLLFMGRLNEIKGPDILLDTFMKLTNKFADWHMVFAGPDGGMEKLLKEKVDACGLEERVHFIGFISGREKSEAYHAAKMLVIPSRLEAMSIVALEAGACGTPVVMTDQCGFKELVDAGGGLETAVSVASLTDRLGDLMAKEDSIQQMGLNAKDFVLEHYTWEIAARRHQKLCKDVLSEQVAEGRHV